MIGNRAKTGHAVRGVRGIRQYIGFRRGAGAAGRHRNIPGAEAIRLRPAVGRSGYAQSRQGKFKARAGNGTIQQVLINLQFLRGLSFIQVGDYQLFPGTVHVGSGCGNRQGTISVIRQCDNNLMVGRVVSDTVLGRVAGTYTFRQNFMQVVDQRTIRHICSAEVVITKVNLAVSIISGSDNFVAIFGKYEAEFLRRQAAARQDFCQFQLNGSK